MHIHFYIIYKHIHVHKNTYMHRKSSDGAKILKHTKIAYAYVFLLFSSPLYLRLFSVNPSYMHLYANEK